MQYEIALSTLWNCGDWNSACISIYTEEIYLHPMVSMSVGVRKKKKKIFLSALNYTLTGITLEGEQKAWDAPTMPCSLQPLRAVIHSNSSFCPVQSDRLVSLKLEETLLKWKHRWGDLMERTPSRETEYQKSMKPWNFCRMQFWRTWPTSFLVACS